MNTEGSNPHRVPVLVGCGVLEKELRFLIHKNRLALETDFLTPALHVDFGALKSELTEALASRKDQKRLVCYGACHPQMDRLLSEAQAIRFNGQNCLSMLLGEARYEEELAKGTYFLLESWAQDWDRIIAKTLGTNPEWVQEIFRAECTRMLALTTPCSGDFTAFAQKAAAQAGLPLEWEAVGLDHLEAALLSGWVRLGERVP
ncbi:MAG: hypothetical protein A2600_04300 [Candidatus Lambdaproteobacteria bacterium RIFOXYD1_FULL_56_27]|uniref:DUF1638 domain-containing protein n=1 Tax=Candidatus Lambdaproteobacteria bacterium RIFOXYD2_FULL_56_26 TaxID=1817773 RepID=A0A1F6H3L1_9PROT|nr:MAG: hypothetical protein A2426_02100 [Candidatus Lambdaproteobacteria bacterium RIFOXYC1_FULL_56_13]OGH04977.1 MAG: hypothetical protein A2557_08365 [Candidatus Lambdaproteobacteria bacterium RIFOXYD2_FULL_56_26]OGH09442.1 MAG: hypothetical protein A2600_04300 [Candidatus Lambdaproteobacteria bacterium RIFOXYD1_FULL_56_27]